MRLHRQDGNSRVRLIGSYELCFRVGSSWFQFEPNSAMLLTDMTLQIKGLEDDSNGSVIRLIELIEFHALIGSGPLKIQTQPIR